MKIITRVYGVNGKEYKLSSLKYGIKKGMMLLLDGKEFYTCEGNEKPEYVKGGYNGLTQSFESGYWRIEL